MIVKFKKEKGVILPSYESLFSSGADIRAYVSTPLNINPHSRAIVPTGLYVEIPEGYEIQIRSRSGLAAKKGLFVLNSPGTIDADYRGEVKIIVYNTSDEVITINNADRIAQAVLTQVFKIEFQETENLSSTQRANKGFGSTGCQ